MATYDGGLIDPAAVRLQALSRSFGARKILDAIDLTIPRGEFVALLGHSGSGKTTLLRALAGLNDTISGSGRMDIAGTLAVVFQDARLLPWKRLIGNVTFGLRGPDPASRAAAALAEVGLRGRETAWPHELSGGEQQRVALARALVRAPELLLADEPFGALDALTRIRMHGLLRRLCERHRPAVLMVTHDVDEAIHLADRVLVLKKGKIAVDVCVDRPVEPAERGAAAAAQLRAFLLGELGVENDDRRAA